MPIDWKARSIVNSAIRHNSATHQTLLLDKRIGYDLALSKADILNLLSDLEKELDTEISDEELESYSDNLSALTVSDLYHITKNKLK